ncbi:protein CURLY FLAG LEAF 1 [Euphorbia lathyris]|uniref:protein CURLY FLAG LEAF 1 n=1 Tax=Euphorbia lathyris TaxID=212925 RepID=UPI003313F52B
MTAPNMAAITASLERSLQNCSLNHHQNQNRGFLRGERRSSSSSSSNDVVAETSETPLMEEFGENHNFPIISSSSSDHHDTTLELNSHLSLPYHWEQCLDLKTGEIYYINWRNGMKATEDPRLLTATTTTTTTTTEDEQEYNNNLDFYNSEEEEEDEESSYDSEESSSEYSSPPPPREENQNYGTTTTKKKKKEDQVLVVAGCKSCLMYFMVPKQVEDCPKCNGQLLHFDRSENGSP